MRNAKIIDSIIGPIKQMQSPVIFIMSSFYIDVYSFYLLLGRPLTKG